jgi:tRNA(fMet)-specific endonuclease VapC
MTCRRSSRSSFDDAALLIAAHALALGCTIVTGDIEEFSRVEGLRVENWLR